jgi:hypothetical protein
MDENKIKSIFIENLSLDDLRQSITETRRKISRTILLETLENLTITHEQWELAINVNDALCYADYFYSLPRDIPITPSLDFFRNLGFLYKTWEESLRFAYRNYDTPQLDYARKHHTKEEFSENANLIQNKLDNIKNHLAGTGSISIDPLELLNIKKTLELILYIIIGHNSHTKFIEKINQGLLTLRILARSAVDNNKNVH